MYSFKITGERYKIGSVIDDIIALRKNRGHDYLKDYPLSTLVKVYPFASFLSDAQTEEAVINLRSNFRYVINKLSRNRYLRFSGVYSIKRVPISEDHNKVYISILSIGTRETLFIIVKLLSMYSIDINRVAKSQLIEWLYKIGVKPFSLLGGIVEVEPANDSFYDHCHNFKGMRNYQPFGKLYGLLRALGPSHRHVYNAVCNRAILPIPLLR